MQTKTDTRDRALIPLAAHAEILKGSVVLGYGVITFGAWSFPATTAFLGEVFNVISSSLPAPDRLRLSRVWVLILICADFSTRTAPLRYRITW